MANRQISRNFLIRGPADGAIFHKLRELERKILAVSPHDCRSPGRCAMPIFDRQSGPEKDFLATVRKVSRSKPESPNPSKAQES